jgi:hypothetical protein
LYLDLCNIHSRRFDSLGARRVSKGVSQNAFAVVGVRSDRRRKAARIWDAHPDNGTRAESRGNYWRTRTNWREKGNRVRILRVQGLHGKRLVPVRIVGVCGGAIWFGWWNCDAAKR